MKRYLVLVLCIILSLSLVIPSFGCKKREYPYRVTLEQASEIIEAAFPFPTYLPAGFEVAGIYVLEQGDDSEHFVILITDKAVDEAMPNFDEIPMKMYVTLHRKGHIGGLKLVGEWYDIGKTKGVLVTRESTNALWWILSYPKPPGQYALTLSAVKEIPKEELVKVARSVPQLYEKATPLI